MANPTPHHEEPRKQWTTEAEIQGRFPRAKHEEFMRRAIANSRRAGVEQRTGGAFGAVIVDRDGQVIADGFNRVIANNDPTWHGEIDAIRTACAKRKSFKIEGCILYTSAEPCPMCLAAAYWAGLNGIVYAALTSDSKTYGNFDDAFIYKDVAKPPSERSIPMIEMCRDEAIEVWKEYAEQPDNVQY
jgi:tRNA(Arg) A34 adenosine deaminase TadA